MPLIAAFFPEGGLRFRADLQDSFVVNTYSGGFLHEKKKRNLTQLKILLKEKTFHDTLWKFYSFSFYF